MKTQILLDPTAANGGGTPAETATASPVTTAARVANHNSFLQLVTADGKELFLEVENNFQQAIQPIVQYTANQIVAARTTAQSLAEKEATTVVDKLAQAEEKHPYTTLIIIGTAILAFLILLLVAIRF